MPTLLASLLLTPFFIARIAWGGVDLSKAHVNCDELVFPAGESEITRLERQHLRSQGLSVQPTSHLLVHLLNEPSPEAVRVVKNLAETNRGFQRHWINQMDRAFATKNALWRPQTGVELLWLYNTAYRDDAKGASPLHRAFFDETMARAQKVTSRGTFDWDEMSLVEKNQIGRALDESVRITKDADFGDSEIERINAIKKAFELTRAELFHGRNAQLKEIRFRDPVTEGGAKGTVDEYIERALFQRTDGWWVSSRETARVTGKTSQSPLLSILGADSERTFYWPDADLNVSYRDRARFPHLKGLRIALNSNDRHDLKMIELMVRDAQNKWQPFVYERAGTTWMPARTFNGQSIPQACTSCHADVAGNFHPTPVFFQGPEDYRKSGFKDEELIRHLWRAAVEERRGL